MGKKSVARIVTAVFLIIMVVYKVPINFDKSYKGYTLYNDEGNTNKQITIHLKGKLSRNFMSDNVFSGRIILADASMDVNSALPGNLKMRLEGIKSKIRRKPLIVYGTSINKGYLETTGRIHISRDFEELWGYSKEMREKFKDTDIIFVAPAENEQEAKAKMEGLNDIR